MICLRSIANSQDQPVSPHPEMINQIYKKYGLENSQDKKTSDGACHIFRK